MSDSTRTYEKAWRDSPSASFHLTVVLGGARSGKSTYAETLARRAAGGETGVFYLATAEAGDEEMAARIAAHRDRRPDHWATIEAPRRLATAIEAADVSAGSVLLFDCVTLLASNILTGTATSEQDDAERVLFDELEQFLALARTRSLTVIVVSNEVGWGIVPMQALSRRYRDLVGRANRWLVAAADEAYLVVAGRALDLERLGAPIEPDFDDATPGE